MPQPYDAVVLGLGATGSAALYQLARRGARVLGIDRASPPHTLGSSHGGSRITRQAIGEGAQYVPLALRSYAIWRELEAASGEELLAITGGLILSSDAPHAVSHVADFFGNTVAAARAHGIAHEILDAHEIRRRFPPFRVGDDERGYYEPQAGVLRPEACVRVQLELAEKAGASLWRDTIAASIAGNEAGAIVETDRGRCSARRVIVAAGPWVRELMPPQWVRRFAVTRQVMYWFDVDRPERFSPGRFPIFIWELQNERQPIYGFPAMDGPRGGVKIASEQFDATTSPGEVERGVHESEAQAMLVRAQRHFEGIRGPCLKAAVCLYTGTPDFHFAIDFDPRNPAVLFASPCSGHGFKHSAALGEALAELALEGRSAIDLQAFSIARFDA